MDKKMNHYIIHYIFTYLNGLELHIASQVCRFWLEIADNVKKMRGPSYMIKGKKDINHYKNLEMIKRKMIICCHVRPFLNMFSIVCKNEEIYSKGCHCDSLPLNSCSISLMYTCPLRSVNNIEGMFFPEVPNIKISTIIIDKYDIIYQFKKQFESFFGKDRRIQKSLIILCEKSGLCRTRTLVENLMYWFPNQQISIWGGIIKKLSICNISNDTKSFCKCYTDSIAILINGTDMRSWILYLDVYSCAPEKIEKKFQILQKKVKLKKHSIGLLLTNDFQGDYLHKLKPTLFRRFFPNVPIITFLGVVVFGGRNLQKTYKTMWDRIEPEEEAVFMILTYN